VKSVNAMIEQLEELIGTLDITAREDDFLTELCAKYNEAKAFKKKYPDGREPTHFLSTKQLDVIDNLYKKHFGDD